MNILKSIYKNKLKCYGMREFVATEFCVGSKEIEIISVLGPWKRGFRN